MKFRLTISFLAILLLGSCDKFEFDPNQSSSVSSQTELNARNLSQLLSTPGDSVLTIALISDSHTYYRSLEKVVESINARPEVDFIVHAGDISDHGYVKEFEKGVVYLQKLHKPFLVVIGNHDLLANGGEVYRKMFGPANFSFVYQGVKFIFYDSNSREYGFNGAVPDLGWLQNELQAMPAASQNILISHVPFFNEDYDVALRKPYTTLLNDLKKAETKIVLALSGHQHEWYEETGMGQEVPHIGPGSTQKGNYYLIRITKGAVSYEKISY